MIGKLCNFGLEHWVQSSSPYHLPRPQLTNHRAPTGLGPDGYQFDAAIRVRGHVVHPPIRAGGASRTPADAYERARVPLQGPGRARGTSLGHCDDLDRGLFCVLHRLCSLLTRQRIGSTSPRCSSALLLMTGPSRPRYARAFSMCQSSSSLLISRWALQHKAASTETEAQG